jgi:hypothetical protein
MASVRRSGLPHISSQSPVSSCVSPIHVLRFLELVGHSRAPHGPELRESRASAAGRRPWRVSSARRPAPGRSHMPGRRSARSGSWHARRPQATEHLASQRHLRRHQQLLRPVPTVTMWTIPARCSRPDSHCMDGTGPLLPSRQSLCGRTGPLLPSRQSLYGRHRPAASVPTVTVWTPAAGCFHAYRAVRTALAPSFRPASHCMDGGSCLDESCQRYRHDMSWRAPSIQRVAGAGL